jgi:uncharacterized repeat protein (TIGR02543 family)
MNTPLVRKVVTGAAVACAVLLIAALLAPKASGPIANSSPSPSPSSEVSSSPEASESASPSPTASPVEKFRLTVVMTGAENGSLISIPAGINCPTKCSALFPAGTFVKMIPQAGPPPAGYDMTWMDWVEVCPGEGITCETTMTSNKTFNATFRLRPSSFALQVTVHAGGEGGIVTSAPGGINCTNAGTGTTCTANFSAGEVILTAAAASGYTFAGWSGACTGTGTCTVSLGAWVDVPPVEVGAQFNPITPP